MFSPVWLFLGIKYAFSCSKERFISFVSLSALTGITIGVAILLTVCSVMNGFTNLIHNQLGMQTQLINLQTYGKKLPLDKINRQLSDIDTIKKVIPYIKITAALQIQQTVKPIRIKAILPENIIFYSIRDRFTSVLNNHRYALLVNNNYASNVDISFGEKVMLIMPKLETSLIGNLPVVKRFVLRGILDNQPKYSAFQGFMNLHDAQKLKRYATSQYDGIDIILTPHANIQKITQQIQSRFGDRYYVSNWSSWFSNLFEALSLQKTMMIIILSLIVIMACFNLLSSLVMFVNDKKKEIAMLSTLGLSAKQVMYLFITQGMMIGFFGVLFGSCLGFILSKNITNITASVEHLIGKKLVSSAVYLADYLPSQFQLSDMFIIMFFTLCLCFLATLYPACRAARLSPSLVLRRSG